MSLLHTGGRVPQVFPSFLLKRLLEVLISFSASAQSILYNQHCRREESKQVPPGSQDTGCLVSKTAVRGWSGHPAGPLPLSLGALQLQTLA